MTTNRLIRVGLLAALAAPMTLWAQQPAMPKTPAAVTDIISARPFALDQGYKFEWRKEQPLVTEGYILVLRVDPALVVPRQCAEPILYVGNQTAERVNTGYPSGRVIAIVPGKVDLTKAPIWFGAPGLPERCDEKMIEVERAKARKAGIKPFDKEKIGAALKSGDKALKIANRDELGRVCAQLIKTHAPQESERAEGLLVPRTE